MKKSFRIAVSLLVILAVTSLSACSVNINISSQADLSEWNAKSKALDSVKDFVTASVDKESEGYIPVKDRIAVFDMDGTLTCETFFTYFDTCMFIDYCLNPAKEMRAVIKRQLCIIDPKEFNVPGKKNIPDIQYRW